MGKLIDLTGKRFGRWKVLAIHPQRYRWGIGRRGVWHCVALWHCRCDCGTERIVHGNSLRRGWSKSCGCLRREKFIKRVTRHGMSNTRVHNIWKAMLQRCLNPRHAQYLDYGGRGITVCEDWLNF